MAPARSRSFLVASLLLLAPSPAWAAGPATPPAAAFVPAPDRRLALADAQKLAEAHARSALAAARQAAAAQAARRKAEAALWPGLAAQADASRNQPSATGSAALTLSWDLDTAGARNAGIELARAQARVAELELARTRQQLALDVALAYYDAQEAEERVRIAELDVSVSATSRKDAESLRRAGAGTVFDVQRAAVQLAAARQGLADAIRGRTLARRKLVRLLGLPPDAAPVPGDAVAVAGRWPLALPEAIARAVAARPEPAQALAEREIARRQGWLSWAGLLPRSQVFATGSAQAATLMDGWTPVPLPSQVSPYGGVVGARVAWPLFDGGAAWAGADQAAALEQAAEIRYADVVAAIQLEVEEAHAALEATHAQLAFADEALATARAGLASARKRFKGGVGVQTDVLLAQQDLIRAEGDRVRAILGYNRALAALRRATLEP